MPSTTRDIPRQAGPGSTPRPPAPAEGALSGQHVLIVAGRRGSQAEPGADVVAGHARSGAARVSLLNCANTITDLVGHRIAGRPDLVIGVLPGRGPSLAAVRVAERMGAPLLVLLNHDGPSSWGEHGTMRRAARVVLTGEDLRERVLHAGVRPERIEVWHSFTPGAEQAFHQLARRTMSEFSRPVPSGL